MGQWLSERLGQQFIIENRPGGGGNIGIEAVVRAVPDGYTLLITDISPTINATLFDKLNFNFIRDIAPVVTLVGMPNVVVVNPSLPFRTVLELTSYAKANPGKLNMASLSCMGRSEVRQPDMGSGSGLAVNRQRPVRTRGSLADQVARPGRCPCPTSPVRLKRNFAVRRCRSRSVP
jgi:hypothetical protein